MSDTTDVTSDVTTVADEPTTGTARRRRGGTGLSALLLPELQSMAASLGISGTARMRKGELITAITERQGGGAAGAPRPRGGEVAAAAAPVREEVRAEVAQAPEARTETGGEPEAPQRSRRASRAAGPPEARTEAPAEPATEERTERGDREGGRERRRDRTDRHDRNERDDRGERAERNDRGDRNERAERDGGRNDRGTDRSNDRGNDRDEDDADGGRRGRRSRFRDRRRGRGERAESSSGGGEPQVSEDDVLVPVAGILDVLDNYAFVRTTGYLSGPNDVYVSMAQVKRYGLRRGDAVTGAVRQAREGEQRRDKYNPLVRLDSINGMDPE
ncbi:Rho termination factor N-terminal domain-containing protein, partial [Rhizomonospora bruguierae]|uniref:Rho termination factor N-terminal domain-containing protein n=1 Tax=Rhizomonospora bruguierae TaxID=1581705 RepID=UPI001BCBBC63